MNDFIFHNPDKVYFGRNQMGNLPAELLHFGERRCWYMAAVLSRETASMSRS